VHLLRPALRRDLDVRPVHRNGRRFIELCDRSTGVRLWLSDLGYSVAFLMEGVSLDEVMEKARDALHIELSRTRLAKFAERLASFGLLVGESAGATDVAPIVVAVSGAQTATMINPPAAALAAAAVVPPAVPAGARRDSSATLALSPREMATLLREARGRGAASASDRREEARHSGALDTDLETGDSLGNDIRRTLGRRRARTVHGRLSATRDDSRASAVGVAARRDLTPPLTAAVIRRTRSS
jgi:hypothetical protein